MTLIQCSLYIFVRYHCLRIKQQQQQQQIFIFAHNWNTEYFWLLCYFVWKRFWVGLIWSLWECLVAAFQYPCTTTIDVIYLKLCKIVIYGICWIIQNKSKRAHARTCHDEFLPIDFHIFNNHTKFNAIFTFMNPSNGIKKKRTPRIYRKSL